MKKVIILLLVLLSATTSYAQQKRIIHKDYVEELQEIDKDGTLLYYRTFNTVAATSTRTNYLNNTFGLNGENMTIHIWDGGHALPSHVEYSSRYFAEDIASENGIQVNYHATHTTGTLAATGVVALAKGMANKATIRGYMWNSDTTEAQIAASNGMLVSSHSYGYSPNLLPAYYFGGYLPLSRTWDNILFNNPNYLQVVAAGNDGLTSYNTSPLNSSLPQYDKLTGQATSKNNLVVASCNDAIIDSQGRLSSATISSFSSQGPTDDLRIKPDITGNGSGVYSTYSNNDNSYSTLSGTSMATPNVAGSILLLQQLYKNLYNTYMRSATLKGIALHTADDAGVQGPDAIFGWGLLNSKKAGETIQKTTSIVQELNLSQGQTYTLTVNSQGIETLKASICWTDPAGTSTTVVNSPNAILVNDLDIRVEKNGVKYFPWRLTSVNTNGKGDNSKDNFERIDIDNSLGDYVITVSHKGTLVNANQNYTLVVTGVSFSNVPCELQIPSGLYTPAKTDTTATLGWNYIQGVSNYEVSYKKASDTVWTNQNVVGTSLTLSSLSPSTIYEFKVRSLCSTFSEFSTVSTFTTNATCILTVPTNIQATNIASTFINISWTGTTPFYEIRWRPQGSTTWSSISTTTTSRTISNLLALTTYEVQVRGRCETYSEYSTTFLVTTIQNCIAPLPSVNLSNVTSNTAIANWNHIPDVYYNVRWMKEGSGFWSITYSAPGTTSYQFTGLQQNTTYRIGVSSFCSSGTTSGYTADIIFTTLSDTCTPPTLSITNITTNSATVNTTGTIYYKQSTSTTWILGSSPLTNLLSNTVYNVESRNNCGITTSTFTTLAPTPPCVNPTLNITNITGNSAVVSWGSAQNCDIRISKNRGNGWNTYLNVSSPFAVSGLINSKTYKVRIRIICTSQVSLWSQDYTFRTAVNNSLGQVADAVYPNPTDGYLILDIYTQEKTVIIFNQLGQKVKQVAFDRIIFIGDLPKGIYFVNIGKRTFKIILK